MSDTTITPEGTRVFVIGERRESASRIYQSSASAVAMERRCRDLTHTHSNEMLNARTWSTGSRGLRALFPEAGRPTVSIMTGT
jgi:hypothetical protein